MKKILILLAVMSLAFAPASFAAVALQDAQLDGITAGDWIVIDPSTQQVWDVYKSNNTLDLSDESQMELQAVSNANAVDSAIAVQTNIASVTGAEPSTNVAVNGYNEADILNYNPADSSASKSSSSSDYSSTSTLAEGGSLTATTNESSSSSKDFKLDETLDVLETFDLAAASASASESNCKGCSSESVSASALLIDYDYTSDYDKHIVKSKKEESSAASSLTIAAYKATSSESETSSSSSSESSSRNNHGENNHLTLKDTAQEKLQVVSNLNAVGSGAAIQTNIASNVGVSGTISHTNIATVVNGL